MPSPTATQPTVAKTTRVCAYDRPNTRQDGPGRSTPVPQPHSVQQDVDDVVKLIAAAHLSTPLVVVAHSYGGLIADLLARTHPELVSGLVFVDPMSEFLPRLGRPEQDAEFNRAARAPTPEPDGEGFLAVDAYARFKLAPPLPKVPAIVLSSDKFPPPADLEPDRLHQIPDSAGEQPAGRDPRDRECDRSWLRQQHHALRAASRRRQDRRDRGQGPQRR